MKTTIKTIAIVIVAIVVWTLALAGSLITTILGYGYIVGHMINGKSYKEAAKQMKTICYEFGYNSTKNSKWYKHHLSM